MNSLHKSAIQTRNILGLASLPVGVKFIFSENEIPEKIENLSGHRYCQALINPGEWLLSALTGEMIKKSSKEI